jgi:ADP-ribose pyrophosphatase YjhB (NUDIX family)
MSYTEDMRRLIGTRPLLAPGVAVLVLNQAGQLLLLQRADNHEWTLPGGFMELNEAPEGTARRELDEEIGLTAGTLQLFGAYGGPELFHTFPNGDQVSSVTIAYITRDTVGTPRVDGKEVIKAEYFDLHALPANLFKTNMPILREVRIQDSGFRTQ